MHQQNEKAEWEKSLTNHISQKEHTQNTHVCTHTSSTLQNKNGLKCANRVSVKYINAYNIQNMKQSKYLQPPMKWKPNPQCNIILSNHIYQKGRTQNTHICTHKFSTTLNQK